MMLLRICSAKLQCWLLSVNAIWILLSPLLLAYSVSSRAQDADALAKQLSNPVANLISVPLQNNFDFGGGPDDDGMRYTLNAQPVIPISIGTDWNLISRTIVPVINQRDYVNDGGWHQSGLGDVVQSFFFSPKEPTASGIIWGLGPAFLMPTGSNDSLSAEKWAAGPTGVLLVQKGSWTYGILANHLIDFAGSSRRADVNATFLQPFLSYGLGGGVTLTLNSESTYDWESKRWTAPVNIQLTKVTKLGGQLISWGGGIKTYVAGPDSAPDWGLRLNLTLLFPK